MLCDKAHSFQGLSKLIYKSPKIMELCIHSMTPVMKVMRWSVLIQLDTISAIIKNDTQQHGWISQRSCWVKEARQKSTHPAWSNLYNVQNWAQIQVWFLWNPIKEKDCILSFCKEENDMDTCQRPWFPG